MLQKAISATTSSKSLTNSAESPTDTPVQFAKGVGPRLAFLFKSRDIETVRDLLYFFPRAYEDRSRLVTTRELKEGIKATLALRIINTRKIPIRGKAGRFLLESRATDETGTLNLKWFHPPRGLEQRLSPGVQMIVSGTPKYYREQLEIIHPEITWSVAADSSQQNGESEHYGRIVPVYSEIEGIPSRSLRKILWEALNRFSPFLREDLPQPFLNKYALPSLPRAVRSIHFPEDQSTSEAIQSLLEFKTPAHSRLIYEEFFKFEYLVLRQRLRMAKETAVPFGSEGGRAALKDLEKSLPFQLTSGQKNAVEEILKDLGEPHPMNRMIQGDVGSGKTAVAFLTAGCVLAEGGQAALMAPTEILAEQHFKNATTLFGNKLHVSLLTGKSTTAERAKLHSVLQSGKPVLLIGTHALIEDAVQFKNLRYVLIDEQHRFGVEQRRALKRKGIQQDSGKLNFPHTLVLTATPIPRTLALTVYGDLSVSLIRELPPGRSPAKTRVVTGRAERARAMEEVRRQLKFGHQAYFIFPLVNESEAEGFTQLKSAVAESEAIAQGDLLGFRVGLLHGQQKPDEKADIMEKFKKHEIDVLVSTTVVEVGVDVPNATVIAIEHAERFGLSQLHQLRGRVGRGTAQSHCYLFTHSHVTEETQARLSALEDTHDGFKIAEADLEFRGPGEFLGTRQAGGLPFRLANLVRDREWLIRARNDVIELIQRDPDLKDPENAALRSFFEKEGTLQLERLKTS